MASNGNPGKSNGSPTVPDRGHLDPIVRGAKGKIWKGGAQAKQDRENIRIAAARHAATERQGKMPGGAREQAGGGSGGPARRKIGALPTAGPGGGQHAPVNTVDHQPTGQHGPNGGLPGAQPFRPVQAKPLPGGYKAPVKAPAPISTPGNGQN